MPQALLPIPAAITENLDSLPLVAEFTDASALAIHLPGKDGGTCKITGADAAKLLSTPDGIGVLIEGCQDFDADLDEISLEIHGILMDEDDELYAQLDDTFNAVDIR